MNCVKKNSQLNELGFGLLIGDFPEQRCHALRSKQKGCTMIKFLYLVGTRDVNSKTLVSENFHTQTTKGRDSEIFNTVGHLTCSHFAHLHLQWPDWPKPHELFLGIRLVTLPCLPAFLPSSLVLWSSNSIPIAFLTPFLSSCLSRRQLRPPSNKILPYL